MKKIPAIFAAGLLLVCSNGLASASQVHGSLDYANNIDATASQIASLNDFRSFLANGCAVSRGVSGGSRLSGNFTICGSEAIDASNHNLRRSMTMSGMPDDGLRLNTGADGFDFKQRRYGKRVDWIDRAMGRRAATGNIGPGGAQADDGMGGRQIASLVSGEDESGATAVADAGPSGPQQIGGSDGEVFSDNSSDAEVANLPSAAGATISGTADQADSTAGLDASGDSAPQGDENAVAAGEVDVGLNGDSGAQSLETTDSAVATDGGDATGSLDAGGSLDSSGSLDGADNAGTGDSTASDAADGTADGTGGAIDDGVQVSDELVGNGDESITTLEDGVPSTSESFFTEIDDQNAQADAADVAGVPIPGSLPLLLTGLAAWGFIGRSRKKI